jgi:hypothetical protein
MKRFGVITAAVLLCLAGATTAYADKDHGDKKDKKENHGQGNADRNDKDDNEQQGNDDHGNEGKNQGKKVGWGNCNMPPGQAKKTDCGNQGRVSPQRQQQLIALQEQRIARYRNNLTEQRLQAAQQRMAALQQGRAAQYSSQQDYLNRMRQQQTQLQNDRNHDYASDPYFSTAPTFTYTRAGKSYQTNQYGADLLRQAVNYGYAEGLRTGKADRQDHSPSNYRDAYAYQDANYGYSGYYVDQQEYNSYFRQGFQRGYQDGFGNQTQYGTALNGTYGVLANIMGQILNLRTPQ